MEFYNVVIPTEILNLVCVHTKDLPLAMRPKLCIVVILSSRPIFNNNNKCLSLVNITKLTSWT